MMKRQEARKKAVELVSRMTVEERAGQLMYDAPAIPRLGIPAYNWWGEGLHGVARAGQATVFPQAIALAAAFDKELIFDIASVIADEGRAKYNAYSSHGDRGIYKGLTFWSPNVNIFRDPRWGRGHETYGEDPFLTKTLGVSFVKGLQGGGETMKAAACAKHFAVHSGPEAERHHFDAEVSKKDMFETYLPAFRGLVQEAGVEAVMGAYNRVNGEAACASRTLQDILRGDWGFEGHFVSDCWAIRDIHENHMITSNPVDSAALAINTGCDLNCGITYHYIMKAYEKGLVSEETITQAAVRLFTARFMLGLFDGSEYDKIPYMNVESPEHLALSEKAAEESFVLLKNDGLLPLNMEDIRTISVIGPNADSRAALVGNYHGTASRYVTIQEGIQDYVGDKVRVLTSVGCDLFRDRTEGLAQVQDRIAEAVTAAENSDLVVLCVGLDETLEGEEGDTGNSYASGDKSDLLLPEVQRQLMEAVAETGKPVVLCLMAGSDIDLSYAAEHFDAVMVLWYPGAMGGRAFAKVLFGEAEPGGKLPVTFYNSIEELPEFTDYSMKGRTYRFMEKEAQYPFGYGLTYGDIRVTGAEFIRGNVAAESCIENADGNGSKDMSARSGSKDVSAGGGSADLDAENCNDDYASGAGNCSNTSKCSAVAVQVKNESGRASSEVVQIYIKNLDSDLAVPNPQLCGFTRVKLLPGESRSVTVPIPEEAFMVVSNEGEYIYEGSRFMIYAGICQPDRRSAELTHKKPVEITVSI